MFLRPYSVRDYAEFWQTYTRTYALKITIIEELYEESKENQSWKTMGRERQESGY